MVSKKRIKYVFIVFAIFILQLTTVTVYAAVSTNSTPRIKSAGGEVSGGDGVGASGTVTPDLFTGTMSYSIPIEVVPGRKGIQPNLALTYRSNNGNGWVGVGWDLEIGAIERSTKNGVDFNGTNYVLRIAGSAVDLISDSSGIYHAKIEGAFYKIEKLNNGQDGRAYWKVTDKTGRCYRFGYNATARQDDPGDPNNGIVANPNNIFKWCLDRVQDSNGNYMDIIYTKDNGQIYPDQINYTGNTVTGAGPTNFVKFYRGSRTDAPVMYSTNFAVTTAYRLKSIDIGVGSSRIRTYKLEYYESTKTYRSLLSRVKQFGKDANVDSTTGDITNEASASMLPVRTAQFGDPALGINNESSSYEALPFEAYTMINGADGGVRFVDLDGDGKVDLVRMTNTNNGWYGNGGQVYAALNTGTGWQRASGYETLPFEANTMINGADGGVRFVDLDGDGKVDLVRMTYTNNGWYGVDSRIIPALNPLSNSE